MARWLPRWKRREARQAAWLDRERKATRGRLAPVDGTPKLEGHWIRKQKGGGTVEIPCTLVGITPAQFLVVLMRHRGVDHLERIKAVNFRMPT